MSIGNPQGLGIYEVIQALKNEINRLEKEPESPYYFNIDKAEVELSVAVEKKAEGGINIWVLQIGGGIKQENTHRIKLELTPLVKKAGVRKSRAIAGSRSPFALSFYTRRNGRVVARESRKVRAKRVRARRVKAKRR